MTPEEWNTVINVNLNGVYNVTHNVLPLIPENGRIINLSSPFTDNNSNIKRRWLQERFFERVYQTMDFQKAIHRH